MSIFEINLLSNGDLRPDVINACQIRGFCVTCSCSDKHTDIVCAVINRIYIWILMLFFKKVFRFEEKISWDDSCLFLPHKTNWRTSWIFHISDANNTSFHQTSRTNKTCWLNVSVRWILWFKTYLLLLNVYILFSVCHCNITHTANMYEFATINMFWEKPDAT